MTTAWSSSMDLVSAIVTLLLVMDPLGNVPVFLSVLKTVKPERRRRVLAREVALAYIVLVASVVLLGDTLLRMLRLSEDNQRFRRHRAVPHRHPDGLPRPARRGRRAARG
jgi:small neutral amino acid transporter SnatA (MarC family)